MRLIDADALKKDGELTEWITRDTIRTGKMLKAFSELFVKKIDDAPTVNAVSEEVYTREYILRKDAEMKAYKLEKALEQEPCEDAISREAVRHILNHEIKMPIKVWKKLFELIDCLPSVKPQEPILDKIRAEIVEMRSKQNVGVLECLDIIDKYRGESDCRECKVEHDCYECKKYEEKG